MLFFLSFLSIEAFAIPQTFSQQGRLLDSSDVPVEGSHYLTFRIFESNIATQPLWEESLSINFENGFYRVILGADVNNPLDQGLFANSPLFLELQLGTEDPFFPRQLLNALPYSLHSSVTQSLDGGSVNATQIQVGGMVVIDQNGAWVGPTMNIDWSQIQGMPLDFADGVDNDTVLSEGEVENFVTNAPLDLADGTTIGGRDLQEAISCQEGNILRWDAVLGWDCSEDSVLTSDDVLGYVTQNPIDLATSSSVNGSPILTESATVNWSQIQGVPSGLEDGDDQGIDIVCADGEILTSNSGVWECSPFNSLIDSDSDGILTWNDCDDSEPSIGEKSNDSDCDGVVTSDDCDDNDANISEANGSSSGCALSSCKVIKDGGFSTGDGNYWIDPDGGDSFEVYCDMTTDGGGWTLIMTTSSTSEYGYSHEVWTNTSGGSSTAINPEDQIDAVSQAFYRLLGVESRLALQSQEQWNSWNHSENTARNLSNQSRMSGAQYSYGNCSLQSNCGTEPINTMPMGLEAITSGSSSSRWHRFGYVNDYNSWGTGTRVGFTGDNDSSDSSDTIFGMGISCFSSCLSGSVSGSAHGYGSGFYLYNAWASTPYDGSAAGWLWIR